MHRTEWNALTSAERRQWALDLDGKHRACVGGDDRHICAEPAGTPWGKWWCAVHDDERMARISRNLDEISNDLRQAAGQGVESGHGS